MFIMVMCLSSLCTGLGALRSTMFGRDRLFQRGLGSHFGPRHIFLLHFH